MKVKKSGAVLTSAALVKVAKNPRVIDNVAIPALQRYSSVSKSKSSKSSKKSKSSKSKSSKKKSKKGRGFDNRLSLSESCRFKCHNYRDLDKCNICQKRYGKDAKRVIFKMCGHDMCNKCAKTWCDNNYYSQTCKCPKCF